MKAKIETIILAFIFIIMVTGMSLVIFGLCKTAYQTIIQQYPEQNSPAAIEPEYIEENISETE